MSCESGFSLLSTSSAKVTVAEKTTIAKSLYIINAILSNVYCRSHQERNRVKFALLETAELITPMAEERQIDLARA